MKNLKHKTLFQTGELVLLDRLCRNLPLRGDVIVGAGDDCAVVRCGQSDKFDYLLKSDSCVEGVHFVPQTGGGLIGHKALGRVLSDIAAMGGEPLWVLVDIVAPPETPVKPIEDAYAAMRKLAGKFKAAIVGGDVSSGHELQLHVFGIGRVKKNRALLRSGAKAGEAIFVTGALGGSLAGKHLAFTPRLREGQWIAGGGWATSMIDISDGLLRDLQHITEASKVGAQLVLDSIPVSSAAKCAGVKTALQHALNDGEDYELLFTVPESRAGAFARAWHGTFRLPCVRIGRTTSRKGYLEGINSKGRKIKLDERGFEHFHRRKAQSDKGT